MKKKLFIVTLVAAFILSISVPSTTDTSYSNSVCSVAGPVLSTF